MDMESVFGLLSRGSVFGLGIFLCAHVVVCMLTIVLYSSLSVQKVSKMVSLPSLSRACARLTILLPSSSSLCSIIDVMV